MHHSECCEEYCKSNLGMQVFPQWLHAPILLSTPHDVHRQNVCKHPVQALQQVCPDIQFQFWVVVHLPYEDKRGGAWGSVPHVSAKKVISPLIVMDGLKEQTLGKFCQKRWAAGCGKKTIEPYSPWQNAVLIKRRVGSYSSPTPPNFGTISRNMRPM